MPLLIFLLNVIFSLLIFLLTYIPQYCFEILLTIVYYYLFAADIYVLLSKFFVNPDKFAVIVSSFLLACLTVKIFPYIFQIFLDIIFKYKKNSSQNNDKPNCNVYEIASSNNLENNLDNNKDNNNDINEVYKWLIDQSSEYLTMLLALYSLPPNLVNNIRVFYKEKNKKDNHIHDIFKFFIKRKHRSKYIKIKKGKNTIIIDIHKSLIEAIKIYKESTK